MATVEGDAGAYSLYEQRSIELARIIENLRGQVQAAADAGGREAGRVGDLERGWPVRFQWCRDWRANREPGPAQTEQELSPTRSWGMDAVLEG